MHADITVDNRVLALRAGAHTYLGNLYSSNNRERVYLCTWKKEGAGIAHVGGGVEGEDEKGGSADE